MKTITRFPQATLIRVGDVELEVFEVGQENAGNPIVLCHGWPEHAFSWRHQMPALAAAGYHVIVPNQRGYGNSSCPADVTAYGITQLTGDLAALLDHYGYEEAVFAGHDWGANVVWNMALLHPRRVKKIINLALPYQVPTDTPWIEMLETFFGNDHYFVHFNRRPGVADAVLEANTSRFLSNLFRKNIPAAPPEPGMVMMTLATTDTTPGEPFLSEAELAVYSAAFERSGFTSSINWYRNLDRNWRIVKEIDPILHVPTLMIYGARDVIPPSDTLSDFVVNVDTLTLDCGHWIQQERPDETTQAMLEWLGK